jgi:hypothetical protein
MNFRERREVLISIVNTFWGSWDNMTLEKIICAVKKNRHFWKFGNMTDHCWNKLLHKWVGWHSGHIYSECWAVGISQTHSAKWHVPFSKLKNNLISLEVYEHQWHNHLNKAVKEERNTCGYSLQRKIKLGK